MDSSEAVPVLSEGGVAKGDVGDSGMEGCELLLDEEGVLVVLVVMGGADVVVGAQRMKEGLEGDGQSGVRRWRR